MSDIGIRELAKTSWQTAEEHGWHTLKKSVGEELALVHSEVSETLEEHRDGRALGEIHYTKRVEVEYEGKKVKVTVPGGPGDKPEGIPVELADIVIRIADFVEERNITEEFLEALRLKMLYNETRAYLHGGKRL